MASLPRTYEEWERLPTKPKDRLLGLSRTSLLELIFAGDVKSSVLRKKGSKRSIRLVHMPSLLAYLEAHVEDYKKPPQDDG